MAPTLPHLARVRVFHFLLLAVQGSNNPDFVALVAFKPLHTLPRSSHGALGVPILVPGATCYAFRPSLATRAKKPRPPRLHSSPDFSNSAPSYQYERKPFLQSCSQPLKPYHPQTPLIVPQRLL